MKNYNITELVGNTPIVKIRDPLFNNGNIFLKFEKFNCSGSIKDRTAKYIIDKAEESGILHKDSTILESSSGNFGIALAMIGAAKGYKVKIVIDPKITPVNKSLLLAYGAELITVTKPDPSGSYQKTRLELVKKLAGEDKNVFVPNQAFSYMNSDAHYELTGKEIINDFNNLGIDLDAVIVTTGTCGTIGGVSKYVKEYDESIKIIGVDAKGSGIFGKETHPFLVQGLGLGWTPRNLLSPHNIDLVYKVNDHYAFSMCHFLARNEGILLGASGGAAVFAGMSYIRDNKDVKNIAVVVADAGDRYVDTIYNNEWLIEKGVTIAQGKGEIKELFNSFSFYTNDVPSCVNYRIDWEKDMEPT
ncbi:PLP-dependent cysteine synthase family protein [Vibrio lentus]|uniref:PLP-dependent cysteine synthase family protein n=1 Tax=Vibrio lentus TaxID=136468 RepID=UPI000C84E904|nr:cysteine synthase family protein [Vibrio lentus]PMJ04513.1 hypothetical protein BCU32_03140 [Vibrio lentus]